MNRWLLDHRQAFGDALKRTQDRMTQFVILIVLLGVLLAIPGWLAQIWVGMSALVPQSAIQSESLIFLEDPIELEARIDLERTLANRDDVESVSFVAKSVALSELSALDGLAPIAELVADNPLPDALRLRFKLESAAAGEAALMTTLQDDARVLSLRYYPSTRVQYAALVRTLGWLGFGLSLLTVLGVLMTVFLVSAADVVDDRRRIELYTLLGASRRFILRPYLYRATLLGLLSGGLACLVIVVLNGVLSTVLASNLESLDARLGTVPMDGRILLSVAVIAIVASWIGAERAVNRRLNALH
jgi:cell division transport system permease protein